MLTIVVSDHNLQKTVDVIIRNNQTGNPGDGKIFVSGHSRRGPGADGRDGQ